MSSKIGGEEEEEQVKEWEEDEEEEEEEVIIKNEDEKEDKEFKMDDGLRNTCRDGPLRELKNKINSSNINSRDDKV